MADVDSAKPPSLSEQYLLKEREEKVSIPVKPVEEDAPKTPEDASTVEVPPTDDEENSVSPDPPQVVSDVPAPATEVVGEDSSSPNAEDDTTGSQEESQESADETPKEDIKLETAPADFRFPTTNQTRHCFTRYVEYHRCIAAKGEGAPECDKFAKYYRSLCPGEWVDRWNEQRENGTFPGPL
ncbi:unnamed protein product [Cuscuta campestris]|uniref:Cytochrome c oxidase subunit n=1 Tax=Cuscuta campestris TaxID=132261 RepID=A0A484MDA0_9ASTE|nr:unnamed protein product [Cuscuta campestris]